MGDDSGGGCGSLDFQFKHMSVAKQQALRGKSNIFTSPYLPSDVYCNKAYSSSFSRLVDKLRLCDILFRDKFYNEFYRMKSFDVCRALLHEARKLALAGLYFAGSEINPTDGLTYIYLNCAFCKFETVYNHVRGDSIDHERIERDHNRVKNIFCMAKLENEPIRSKLVKHKIFLPDPTS